MDDRKEDTNSRITRNEIAEIARFIVSPFVEPVGLVGELEGACLKAGVQVLGDYDDEPTGECCENGNFGDGHDCMKQNPESTVATLREPTETDIGNSDTVAVVFIKARIDYLTEQNEECGCAGLLDMCEECYKRAFAIGELKTCL